MRVLIVPDSLKGTCTAMDAAHAIADGWRRVRPDDDLTLIPLADGGEGTLDAVEGVLGAERRTAEVTGPDGRPILADWLLLPTGEAIIELAQAAGLALMDPLDAMQATTRGVGELMRISLAAGATSITVAMGGSATTDGGAGALAALGLHLFDDAGLPIPDGGGSLRRLAWVDVHDLVPPPSGGVRVLTDVTNPLLGEDGAAAVFGPQKGATAQQVDELDAGLQRWADVVAAPSDAPAMGAAGGAAYGLVTLWGARIQPGAAEIARLCGVPEALSRSDVVITAEGRFDSTSLEGKIVGHVLTEASGRAIVIAGGFTTSCPAESISLETLAGSPEAAQSDTVHWLSEAGAAAGDRFPR